MLEERDVATTAPPDLAAILEHLEAELPGWGPAWTGTRGWSAESPTYELDGIVIHHERPLELVGLVRAWERALAAMAGRGGSLPVGHPVAGVDVDVAPLVEAELEVEAEFEAEPAAAPVEVVRQLPSPTELGPPAVHNAPPCQMCGGFMVRTGSCETCQTCGSTSGCG